MRLPSDPVLADLARKVDAVPHRAIPSPFDEPTPRSPRRIDTTRRGAARLDDDVITQVRDAADLVEIIGEFVELHRTGSDYRGPCPFHDGTHRNFSVSPAKQMYYCFVCHEGGDVFTFHMKHLGTDFPGAVREVAQKVGISIPEPSICHPDPHEPLYSAVAVAADWYARRLREANDAEPARRYLQGRDFDLERLLPHGLGFAPRGDDFLKAMSQLGISEDVLVYAGLAVRREDGSLRPRFWNRLVFPIDDARGRVVGFGGRLLGDTESKYRYLNSPNSNVFCKTNLLYHFHGARYPIRQVQHAVLVEGYLDVLRLVLSGFDHVVAPLGTGLTAEQAQQLKRVASRVTIIFDNDKTGRAATFRAAQVLLRAGANVTVATLPAGEDPDSLVRKVGISAVEEVVRDAADVFDVQLQILERKGWLGTLNGRRGALEKLLPTLRAASDPVTRDLYVSRAAERLDISRESVIGKIGARKGPPYVAAPVVETPEQAERIALMEGA